MANSTSNTTGSGQTQNKVQNETTGSGGGGATASVTGSTNTTGGTAPTTTNNNQKLSTTDRIIKSKFVFFSYSSSHKLINAEQTYLSHTYKFLLKNVSIFQFVCLFHLVIRQKK